MNDIITCFMCEAEPTASKYPIGLCGFCAADLRNQKRRDAYKMGYDCGQNGSNTTNCSFSIFSSKENMAEWEIGHRDGKAAG